MRRGEESLSLEEEEEEEEEGIRSKENLTSVSVFVVRATRTFPILYVVLGDTHTQGPKYCLYRARHRILRKAPAVFSNSTAGALGKLF